MHGIKNGKNDLLKKFRERVITLLWYSSVFLPKVYLLLHFASYEPSWRRLTRKNAPFKAH